MPHPLATSRCGALVAALALLAVAPSPAAVAAPAATPAATTKPRSVAPPPAERDEQVATDGSDADDDAPTFATVIFEPEAPYGFDVAARYAVANLGGEARGLEAVSAGVLVAHIMSLGVEAGRLGAPLARRDGGPHGLAMRYEGLEFAAIDPTSVVTVRVGMLAAAGTLERAPSPDDATDARVRAAFYMLEPRWGLYVNILSSLRVGLDLSYRAVAVDARRERGEGYSGPSFGLVLRGGRL